MSGRLKVIGLSAVIALVAGCSGVPASKTVVADPAILRVGVCPISPPMIFKQGDQIVGVEADLAKALGSELGRRVVFIQEKWDDLITSLCENRIDIIMSSMTITPARQYRIAFTRPYLRVNQLALCRDSDKYAFVLNVAAQAKRGFGVKQGTTADFLARQEFPNVPRRYYKTGQDAAEALVSDDIDLFLSDAPMVWHLAGLYETKGLVVIALPTSAYQEDLGWGIRREDNALRDSANAFLAKAQSSGELNRIYSQWMPGFK